MSASERDRVLMKRGYLQGYKDGIEAARDALVVPLLDEFGLGCQNIPCMISIPRGQHTNGRCQCTAERYRRQVADKLDRLKEKAK